MNLRFSARTGSLGAQRGAPDLQRAHEKPPAFLAIACRDDRRKGMQDARSPLVPLSVDALVPFERFLEKRPCPVPVIEQAGELAERLQRFERLGMIRPALAALFGQGFVERLTRLGVLPSRLMDETEDLLHLRAHGRRRAQELERARLRAGQELAERHPFAVRAHGRVRRLEQIDQQANDLLRRVALRLRDRGAARPTRVPATPRPRRTPRD